MMPNPVDELRKWERMTELEIWQLEGNDKMDEFQDYDEAHGLSEHFGLATSIDEPITRERSRDDLNFLIDLCRNFGANMNDYQVFLNMTDFQRYLVVMLIQDKENEVADFINKNNRINAEMATQDDKDGE